MVLRPLISLASIWIALALALPACGTDDAAGGAGGAAGSAASASDATSGGSGGAAGGAGASATTTTVTAADGGTVQDAAAVCVLSIPPGALAEDTEITLTIDPKTSETVTPVCTFTSAKEILFEPAASQPSLTILAPGATPPGDQRAVIAVDQAGTWTELEGSVQGSGSVEAPVPGLGSFAVIFVDAFVNGSCDPGCMSQPGAECCSVSRACCTAPVACEPRCPAGTLWECGDPGRPGPCCFDYGPQQCVP